MSASGHSRPSHFVPVLNNVRYASVSDHSRYESESTLWANRRHRSFFVASSERAICDPSFLDACLECFEHGTPLLLLCVDKRIDLGW
jgi:hypothetical protein